MSAQRPTILLVDDDESVRAVISRALQQFGYTVLTAADADEALDLCLEHLPSIELVLLDLVLPGKMKASQLASHLQIRKPTLKIIFSSGYEPEHFAFEVHLEEGINFLGKPYSATQLKAFVKRLLNQHPGN